MMLPRQVDLAHAPMFRLGSLLVEPSLLQVRGTATETLEPKVMQVLVALADADGAILSRDDLVSRCWEGRIIGDDSINRVISRLRRLAADHGDCFQIETVHKVGHRLLGTVRVPPPPPPKPRQIFVTGGIGADTAGTVRQSSWQLVALGLSILFLVAAVMLAWKTVA